MDEKCILGLKTDLSNRSLSSYPDPGQTRQIQDSPFCVWKHRLLLAALMYNDEAKHSTTSDLPDKRGSGHLMRLGLQSGERVESSLKGRYRLQNNCSQELVFLGGFGAVVLSGDGLASGNIGSVRDSIMYGISAGGLWASSVESLLFLLISPFSKCQPANATIARMQPTVTNRAREVWRFASRTLASAIPSTRESSSSRLAQRCFSSCSACSSLARCFA